MATTEKIIVELNLDYQDAKRKLGDLQRDFGNLRKELETLNPETQEYFNTLKKLEKTDAGFRKQSESVADLEEQLKKVRKTTQDYGKASGKSIAQVEKEVKDLTKIVKNAEVGSEEYRLSLQKLGGAKDELKQLSAEFKTVRDESIKSLGGINDEVKFAELSLGELEQTAKQLKKESKNLIPGTQEFDEFAEASAKVNTRIRELNRQLRGTKSLQQIFDESLAQANASIGKQDRSLEELENSLKDLQQAQRKAGKGSQEFRDITEAIGKTETAIKELKEEAKGISSVIENQTQQSADQFNQLKGAIAGSLAVFTVAGLAEKGIETLQQIGQYAIETAREISQLREEIALLTGEGGEDLDNYTAKIKTLSDTTGDSTEQILIAANALLKQKEDVTSLSQSLDLIEKGYLSGANAQGEFLDILREYPSQFDRIGGSAEEFIGIITQSQLSGTFADKVVDSFKEAGIRLNEQTQAAKDALTNAFGGQFTEDILGRIRSGKTPVIEALREISKRAVETGLNAQQTQQLLADVFAGAGEDASANFLETISELDKGLDELVERGEELQPGLRALYEANQEVADAQVRLTNAVGGTGREFDIFSKQLKAFGTNLLAGFIEQFRKLFLPVLEKLGDLLLRIGRVFGLVSDEGNALEDIMNALFTTAELLSVPWRVLVNIFLGFVEVGVSVVEGLETLRKKIVGSVTPAFGGLKDVAQDVLDFFLDLPTYIAAAGEALGTFVEDVFAGNFEGIFERVRKSFSDNLDAMLTEVKQKTEGEDSGSEDEDEDENTGFDIEAALNQLDREIKEREIKLKQALKNERITRKEFEQQQLEDAVAFAERRIDILRKGGKDTLDARAELVDAELALIDSQGKEATKNAAENEAFRTNAIKAASERRTKELRRIYEEQELARLQAIQEGSLSEEEAQAQRLRSEAEFLREKIELLKAYGLDTLEEEQQLTQALIDEEKYRAEQRAKELDDYRQKLEEKTQTGSFQARREAILNLYNFELELAKDNADRLAEIERDKNERLAGLRQEELQFAEEVYGQLTDTINQVVDGVAEAQRRQTEAFVDNIDRRIEKSNEELEAIDQQLEGANNEQKRALVERRREVEKDLEKQNQIRESALKDQAEAERKAALVKQSFALGQAIINIAQAITAAVAANPLTGGLPQTAIIGTIGAIQTAAIAAQSFAQALTFAKGGVVPSFEAGGQIDGPRHSQGGISLVARGRKVGEIEGGETILTRRVAQDPQLFRLAGLLNHAAGGANFASGGKVPSRIMEFGGVAMDPETAIESLAVIEEIRNLGQSIQAMSPRVSVEEIKTVQNRVQVLENNREI